jgi:putative hemolysin
MWMELKPYLHRYHCEKQHKFSFDNDGEVKMSKSNYLKAFGSLFIMVLFISACSSRTATPITHEDLDEHVADMTNPAAVYCEGLGYSMENVIRNGGGDADCIFPDDSRCGQWDFLSGRCGQEYSYCEMEGFNLEEGTNIGICRFPDSSYCDEFLFYSGECSPGDNPDESEEETILILGFSEARDFIAEYFYSQYGIELAEPWLEQNITPEGVVGASTLRFVSGPLTIVISAPVSAPAASVYTIEEASFIVNGFYWEGTLSSDGQIAESIVIPPATILSEGQARDAVVEYLSDKYTLPTSSEWTDQGLIQTDDDTVVRAYTSGSWVAEVEFAPAAPLVSSYQVTIYSDLEGVRWEGDISYHGDIVETSSTE